MKKGDLIIVYKVCIGCLSTDEIPKFMSEIVQKFKFSDEQSDVLQYFVATHNESEHPVEVIDTGNLNNTVFDLLGELLNEVSYNVKNEIRHESKID